jgi:hypothetical protein
MESALEVRITSLLKDGKGPMSPVLFINEVAKELELVVHKLLRVSFENEAVHQIDEGREGYTSHDTLVVVTQYKNCNQYAMVVDLGSKGVPVGLWFNNDHDVTLTPIYKRYPFEVHLTESELRSIFKECDKKVKGG